MNTKQFSGVHTALVTPMKDGKVAYDELEKLVEWQISEGINGIVAVGTTGESPTLSHEEHIDVVRRVVNVAAGRIPVLAGSGSNSTDEAVMLSRKADEAGADGLLVVAPYYNKPSQEGLYRHMAAIAEGTNKPIILYSIPSRCVIEFSTDTVARLHEAFPHILGIKESGGNCDKVGEMVRRLGKDFVVVSGDDPLTLPFMSVGAQGVISVASNLVVRDLVRMVKLANGNDFKSAQEIQHRYAEFFRHIFLEPNPVPIKYALQRSGRISSREVRLPLSPLTDTTRKILDQSLDSLGFHTK